MIPDAVPFAADEPLRTIDVAALMGFIVVGLATIAWSRPIAQGFVRFFRWPDLPSLQDIVRAGLVFLFAPNLVIAALCLLNVVELRPGQPPPGLLPRIWAVAGLAALAVLLSRLVAEALAGMRRRAG